MRLAAVALVAVVACVIAGVCTVTVGCRWVILKSWNDLIIITIALRRALGHRSLTVSP